MDSWPLAIIILDALGGTPVYRYPPYGVTVDGEPPLEVDMWKFDRPSRVPVASSTDSALRNSVVAIGWRRWQFDGLTPREEPVAGCLAHPDL